METPAPAQAVPAAQTESASVSPAAQAAPAATPSAMDIVLAAFDNRSILSDPGVKSALYANPDDSPAPAIESPAPTQNIPALVPEPTKPAGDAPQGEAAPAPAADATVQTEAPAATNEEAEPPVVDLVTGIPLPILPKRIRTNQFSDIDQRAIALQAELKAQGTDINLGEAFDRVHALLSPPEPEEPAAPAAGAPAAARSTSPSIAALEAKAKDLRGKIAAAGEEGSLYTAEIAQQNLEYADTLAEIAAAKAEAQATQRSAQTTSAARTENLNQVLKVYPDADVPGTILGSFIDGKVHAIQADPNHPQRSLLEGADAPSKVATAGIAELRQNLKARGFDEAAINLALGFKGVGSVQPPASQPARAVPKNAAVAAPATAAAPTAAAPLSPGQVTAAILGNRSLLLDPNINAAIYADDGPSTTIKFGR